jgi:TorA maturation chaperone TorD
MRDVEDEYVKLFLGPGKAEVMPYQSIYEGNRIYGETTLKIKSIYSRAGLRIPSEAGLSEDHLGVELQFIAHLCDRAIALLERGENVALSLELQKKFLEENLLPWVQEFCEDVLQTHAANFYRGMARVTRGYLEEDRVLLYRLLAQL